MGEERGIGEGDAQPWSLETVARFGQLLLDGFSVIDPQGVHLAVNDALCEMVGYSREELVGATSEGLYWPEEELETIRAALEQTLDGHFRHFQLTFCRANGERFPVVVSPNVALDEHGEPAFYFATVKDNSDIERAHEALKESEVRYRALADSTPYGIAVHIGGVIRYANTAALELFGGELPAVVGQRLERFVHPDDRELVAARVRGLVDENSSAPWARERFRRLDGATFHADVAGVRIRFEEQDAVQVAFRDATRELERERQQAESNRLEAIGRLAGGVAHDFNNLLTVVMAACSFVREHEGLPEDLRADLQSASEAARHGSELTRQLLAFSRQEPPQLTSVAPGEEFKRLGSVLERMVGEDVVLEVDIAKDCWPIRADRTQFERVLLNLVANARAAMPEGGRVRLQTTNVAGSSLGDEVDVPATQDFVQIVVDDDGVGMDETTRGQVFEPFFTTRRAQGGTGLGLATVYGIVRHSGGAVVLDSEVGRGTTVTILWPRTSRAVQAASPCPQPETAGREVVLVVEDQAPVRKVAVRSLQRDGYTVFEAEGYTDAMAWLEKGEPLDLLLSDVVLRDRTGPAIVDAARVLRPTLRVLFMSGYSDVAALQERYSAVPLLQKPFTPSGLGAAVRAVLEAEERSSDS
ncbi:MAG: PAS domain S-box protein [Nannocystales bacterium]